MRVGAALALLWRFALPQLRLVPAAVGALAGAPPVLLAAVSLLALFALLSYAQLTRTMMGAGNRPGLAHTFGIIATSLGISNVLPAGAAAGGVIAFRMFERAGVGKARAAAAMAATSVGSTAVLNVLLAVAFAALAALDRGNAGLIGAAPSLLLVGGAALAGQALLRRSPALWNTARRVERRLPALRRRGLVRGLDAAADALAGWAAQPRLLLEGLWWATVNWLVDVLALWLTLRMVGVQAAPLAVLAAFALANLAALVPITPGGIGMVELTLTATLVGMGAPAGPTAIGVAAYRVFNYWLPIPGSLLAFAATRLYERHRAGRPTTAPAPIGTS